LTGKIKYLIVKVKELLEQRLDVDFSDLNITEASDYVNKKRG
jgi:hypothetical protein